MGLRTDQIVKILQLKGLGRHTAFKICELAISEVFDSDLDLMDYIVRCISNKLVRRLPEYSKNDLLDAFKQGEKIIEKSEKAEIIVLSIFDTGFPIALKDIPDKPILVNLKGNFKELNNHDAVAIIGTREPTDDGILSAKFFGEQFGKKGYNVVSGLAKGCDSFAHIGCLKGGGMTTAILAHGLHTIYPKENEELALNIIESGGVLLSEYFVGEGARPNYFVERDRLQSGLSKATIVIQTGIKGGTMHAVKATLECNKPLAAVVYKSDSTSDKVKGNELLIRERKAFSLTSSSIDEFINKFTVKAVLNSTLNQNLESENISSPKTPIDFRKRSKRRSNKGVDNSTLF